MLSDCEVNSRPRYTARYAGCDCRVTCSVGLGIHGGNGGLGDNFGHLGDAFCLYVESNLVTILVTSYPTIRRPDAVSTLA